MPEKVCFLMWLAWHESIPTMQVLQKRRVAQSAVCTKCNQHEKTILHCVRDCTSTMQIWSKLGMISLTSFKLRPSSTGRSMPWLGLQRLGLWLASRMCGAPTTLSVLGVKTSLCIESSEMFSIWSKQLS